MTLNRVHQAEELADRFHEYSKDRLDGNDTAFTFLKIWPFAVRLGFNRLLVEARYHGLGAKLDEYVTIIRILSRGDSALALSLHLHNIALKMIAELSKNERKFPFRTIMDENKIVALARSEAGRDYRYNFATEIISLQSEPVLSGQKDFCTLAGVADYYVVFAQTNRDQPDLSTVQVCVIDAKDPSIEVIRANGLNAMMRSSTYSVRFHHYRLSSFELAGEPGDIAALPNPDSLTLGICAVNLGIVDAALADFKQTITRLPPEQTQNSEISRWLGQIDVMLRGTELLLQESLSCRPEMSPESGICVRRAKAACDLLASQVTEGVLRFLGSEGIMSKHAFIVYRNNALAGQAMPPSLHKCLMALGAQRLHINRSPVPSGK
jgi:alkylation response protein AidB-like acyl-CoA dehydrogenase